MSIKNVEENLMDFSSPLNKDQVLNNEINSPGSNPFDSIMQIAETFNSTGIEKELFESRNIDIDCGRESLGILHVDFEKVKFDDISWLNIPNIQVNDETVSPIPIINSSVFNTAFLYSTYSNISNLKSSISSLPDTLKSWEMSKISLPNSFDTNTSINSISALNKAFIDYASNIKYNEKCNGKDNLLQNGLEYLKQRLRSLPDTLNNKAVVNDISITPLNNGTDYSNKCFRKFSKSDSLLKQTFSLPQIMKPIKKENDVFDDSVFMEANYLASKIADESIYEMADGELYSLYDTPKPEWLDICDEVLDENLPKISTADIFKTVDKVILPINSDNNPDTSKISSNSSSSSSLNRNECVQSLTDIFNGETKKLSTSRLSQCSNNSKSKDAKSILHNLSEILSNDNPSVQQKTEGQNLLFSLADILCSNDLRNLSYDRDQSEDSGHSSIDQDVLAANKQDDMNYDALDLRINVETTLEETKPLDLSISKKSLRTDAGEVSINLSKSNNDSNKNSINLSKSNSVQEDKTNNDSNYSNNRNISHVKTNIPDLPSLTKLKPKKTIKKLVSEKGPMKATIPLGNMSKPKGINGSSRIGNTPPKYSQHAPVYQIKRTSTPKTEPKLQPVAQSTPEANSDLKKRIPTSTHLRARKSEGTVSPLTRTNSVDNNSINELNKNNRSGSTPNLSSSSKNVSTINSSQIMFRRRSASDLKLPKDTTKFKRSNTIDKDAGISKTLSRVRENIEKARKTPSAGTKAVATTTNSSQNKVILAERNRTSTSSNIKPCNLVNKLKRSTGKENSVN